MAAKKQYGLIIPKNKPGKSQLLNKPSVFDEGSSDEDTEDSRRKEINSSLRKEGIKKLEAKTTRNMLTDALTEDPTVFDYDNVYDDMQEKKRISNMKLQAKKDTKSKYIASLKRTAEVRKVEQELAYERKLQKERETEGEEFSDKDAFVTPSYLKRLEERAAIEAQLKREEEIEKQNDVTKQDDLSRFYRNMFERKTSGQPTTSEQDKREEMTHVRPRQHHNDIPQTPVIEKQVNSNKEDEEGKDSTSTMEQEEEENDVTEKESETQDIQSDQELSDNDSTSEQTTLPVPTVESPPVETLEERRKRIFAKRTDEDAALSAKERYLARKRAKLSQPIIATDDDN